MVRRGQWLSIVAHTVLSTVEPVHHTDHDHRVIRSVQAELPEIIDSALPDDIRSSRPPALDFPSDRCTCRGGRLFPLLDSIYLRTPVATGHDVDGTRLFRD